jgi:hypothetical protein
MSAPRPSLAGRAWRATRPVRAPLLTVAAYLVCLALLSRATATTTLLGPTEALHLPTVVLGLVAVALRLLVIFVVPAWLACRLLGWLVDRWRQRRAPGSR